MAGLLHFLLFFAVPAGVFFVWHRTAESASARKRMALVLLAAASLGALAHQSDDCIGANIASSAVLAASPGVLPALALSVLGRERLPLPEGLACLILAPISLATFAFVMVETGLAWA